LNSGHLLECVVAGSVVSYGNHHQHPLTWELI
jgi:hypothetical protein